MKKTIGLLICLFAAATTNAQLATFETGLDGFSVAFDPDSEVELSTDFASEGVQSLKVTNTTGGNTGSDFRWVAQFNLDTAIASDCLMADPDGSVVFDLIVPDNGADWSQVTISANSDGAQGWTQINDITGGTPTPGTQTFSYSYSEMGWELGDGFYQMNFAINYGDADGEAFSYYLDNFRLDTSATLAECAYVAVPEPATTGLCLLASLGLLAFRRF
jgi:hypothetical protein